MRKMVILAVVILLFFGVFFFILINFLEMNSLSANVVAGDSFDNSKRCSDSDGGVFPNALGFVNYRPQGFSSVYKDGCVDSMRVKEYFCNKNRKLDYVILSCAKVCKKGACVGFGDAKISVSDLEGNTMNNSFIKIYDIDGKLIESRSVSKGFAYFYNLTTGSYFAVATSEGYSNNSVTFLVTENSLTRASISLKKVPSFVLYTFPPRESTGMIDTSRLRRIINDLQPDQYLFAISAARQENGLFSKDYQDLIKYLDETKTQRVDLIVDPSPPSLRASNPFGRDFVKWASNISKLSLIYPNVKGMLLDDFYSLNIENAMNSFSNPDYLKKVCMAAKTVNPQFKFYAVLYCNDNEIKDQPKKFVKYISSSPELMDCITGSYVFTAPKFYEGVETINSCLDDLKPLNKEVYLGIYLKDVSALSSGDNCEIYQPVSFEQRYKNIEDARKTNPQTGFVFYSQLVNSIPNYCPYVEDAKQVTKMYKIIKELLQNKEKFIY